MEKRIIAGCDEAGRGCILGPLVLAGISIDYSQEDKLKRIGVRDSKELPHERRVQLAKKIEQIAKDVVVMKVGPCKIDNYRNQGVGLNRIEAMAMARLIGEKKGTVYIDLPSRSRESFFRDLGKKENIVAEHKADSKYPAVSAASILAKVRRDSRIRELHGEFGDFGSGYPSDRKTISFLKKPENLRALRPHLREKWSTMEGLLQSRLTSY